jgi:hypothetical protein
MFGSAGHNAFELAALKGLDEVIEGAAAEGVGGYLDVANGGEHDDRKIGVIGRDTIQKSKAIRARHHDVGEDESVVGILAEDLDGFLGSSSGDWMISAAFQQSGDDAAHRLFIIYDQDLFL